MKKKPNFLVILIDDLRYDEYGAGGHPYMKTPHIDRIAHEGALFDRAFHTTPICSPNRASIVTGQYASRHGIIDNVARDAMSHRLENYHLSLQKLGYQTAHVGKWHMGNSGGPRPGYDRWVSFPGHGSIVDPVLNIDSDERQHNGYITDLLNGHAVDFLKKRPESTGKVGAVGFCYGGGMVNYLATRLPDLAAGVAFYGSAPNVEDVPKIKAPLLIQSAETDPRINASWPAFEEALKANNVRYERHLYPGTQHGFHNDTTPRYDAAAAKLAWERTVAFFDKHVR